MKVEIATTKDDILQAIALRRDVLVKEFGYSQYQDEPDRYDLDATIYIIKENRRVIGTVRVRKDEGIHRIQRVAIDVKHRKTGVGSLLLQHTVNEHPQLYLLVPKETIPFYTNNGFHLTGETKKGKIHTYFRMQNF